MSTRSEQFRDAGLTETLHDEANNMKDLKKEETATCRGCGKALIGKPYYMGGGAYIPGTMERCKVNFYGGYVCSSACDKNASLELERTMPGHTQSQSSLSTMAHTHWQNNWKNK